MIIADILLLTFIAAGLVGGFATKIFYPAGLLTMNPKTKALLINLKTCPEDWKALSGNMFHNKFIGETIDVNFPYAHSWRERRALAAAIQTLISERIIQKTLTRGGEE